MTDEAEYNLGSELAKAAELCNRNAQAYLNLASALQEVSNKARNLNGAKVTDPETHEFDPPALLGSFQNDQRGKSLCSDLDRIVVDFLGRAGVWEMEVESYASRILKARAEVPDGAA